MKNKKVLLLIILIISVVLVEVWSFLSNPGIKIYPIGNECSPAVGGNRNDLIAAKAENILKQYKIFSLEAAGSDKINEQSVSLELLGTAIGSIKDPIAYIKDLETNKQGLYKLGSLINGSKVIRITMGEVLLEKNGQRAVLKLSKRGKLWAKMDAEGAAITPISENRIVVNRRELLSAAPSICSSVAKMKITPYESTTASGMIIEGIANDSIIASAGIRNKDVVMSVNNQKISTYQNALQVFSKIKNQPEIRISLLRDGKITNLSYHME